MSVWLEDVFVHACACAREGAANIFLVKQRGPSKKKKSLGTTVLMPCTVSVISTEHQVACVKA